jgi:hypothetical protein
MGRQRLKEEIMKASIMFVKAIVSISILLIAPAQILAEEQAVVQVMAIDTHGNTNAYLENVKIVIDRQNQVVPGLRTKIYQAGLAGTDVGTLYVVVEFASMKSMVESVAKLQADAEWNRLRKIVAAKTDRTMISNSLLHDITP